MSKISFILTLLSGMVLGTAWAQEAREKKDGTRPGEKSPASPPAAPASRAPAAAPIPVPGSVASPSRQRGSTDGKLRRYAESLLRQYDKNKNGNLEKDEWSEMKASWHEADRNGDGTITLDELVSRMAQLSPRGETRAASPSDSFAPSPVRALPPVPAAGPNVPGGEMPQPVRPYASPGATFSRPIFFGGPDRPIDPRAPLVSIQLVMVEIVADAAEKAAAKPQAPASSGLAKATATLPIDLSAPSEKILEELRKLGFRGRLDVLYQIQLTTVDQQGASFQFGLTQPVIHGVTLTQFGQTNNVNYMNTGLRLEIQPRVAGGTVAMTVNLGDSRLGRPEEGVPISTSAKGETIRAPLTQKFALQTTVNVPSGQTIVLSGMTENDGPRKRQFMILLCARVVASNTFDSTRSLR